MAKTERADGDGEAKHEKAVIGGTVGDIDRFLSVPPAAEGEVALLRRLRFNCTGISSVIDWRFTAPREE